MERVAMVAYKPIPGKEDTLRALVKKHLPCLKQHGLVTDKEAFILETKDGTILEIFEWKSEQAMKTAHTKADVQQIWRECAKVSTYTPVNRIAEASNLFAQFTPVS